MCDLELMNVEREREQEEGEEEERFIIMFLF